MRKNKQYSIKDIPHCSTPQNLNINQNKKTINYNVSLSNHNNNNLYNTNHNFSNNLNFLKNSKYTNDNSNDIDFYSSSSSLKDQILSPGDDDLYLYVNNFNKTQIKNNDKINYANQVNNTYNNKQNYSNDFDYNYYMNFNINPKKYKSIDDMNKKTLILDLDETLVHSSFHPLYYNDEIIQPDIFFTILFENKSHDVYVLKRPFLKEFLNKMNEIFNIYIFTASIKEYAYPLLLKLDKNKLITKKLFRESCTLSKDNKFIKDLNVINENLKNVIIIDNNPNSYRYNKCNGLPIKTWHYDKNDKELIKIIPFLSFLATVEDVREYIPKVVDDDQLNYQKINNIINLNLKQNNGSKNKKMVNKIKKNKINNNSNANTNNHYSHSSGKIKYIPTFTNEDSKISVIGNPTKKICNLSCNKKNYDNNKYYSNIINFNQQEERKNNHNINSNNKKNAHSPATINFREPLNHMQSIGHKEQLNNTNNTNKINNTNNENGNGNININQMNKKEEDNKYQRSKSSNNFNELTKTMHKFTSINFNLVNSQSNNKKIKHTIESKIIKSNNKNDVHKIYQNKMADKCLSSNNIMNDNISFSNSFYLDNNNEQILVTYIQNNNINFNTNNNIMSINLKDENSKENLLYKPLKENRTQRNYSSVYNTKMFNQYKSENIFKNRNNINKKKVNIIKNNEKRNNDEDGWNGVGGKKNYNIRNKKLKKVKNNAYRCNNNDNNKNYNNKNISNSKTSLITLNNNNNINFDSINYKNYLDNIDDNKFNTFNKKGRSQTLNGRPISSHRISLNNNKFEENKNCTMEISKNIKKKFYNNCLKDISTNNYKTNSNNYKSSNNSHNKNKSINYNTSKQKHNKVNINKKTDLNNEMNLLNKFMKEFNIKDPKELSYLVNYPNISKELVYSQRLPKNGNHKKNVNTLINFNYYCDKYMNAKNKNKKNEEEKKDRIQTKNEIFNKQYNNQDNFYTNFYRRKNRPYVISKETNNFIKKKMKNMNAEDNYYNDIHSDNNDSDSIKNIKFLSLQKDKSIEKGDKINNNERFFNNHNNSKTSRRRVNYSCGKKNTKDTYHSRTIIN